MGYTNEIKGNFTFWQKVLGTEICNQLLNSKAGECRAKGETAEKKSELQILEYCYRKALTEKIEKDTNLLQEGLFPGFYRVFLKTAYFYCEKQNLSLLKNAWQDMIENLYKRIEKIPLKVLIQDIHRCKEKGLLIGQNSEEEYEDYLERFLEVPAYIDHLCENYLEMKRLLLLQICQTIDLMCEVEKALQRDKEILIKQFCLGKEFQGVLHIDTSLSDCHKGGKTVTKVLLDNGYTIIYKPHNLQKEILYEELYEKFLLRCGLEGRRLQIVSQDIYGWEEYIERIHCESIEEVERYFQRIGVILFLCHLMGATDIHGENLVAAGEYPMLLDLETFPGIKQQKNIKNAEQKIRDLIGNSVLGTGLLPVIAWGNGEDGVIVNALHKNGREMTPFRLPMVYQPKSSEIHIEYQPVEIKLRGSLPVYQNEEMNPSDFEEWISKGFTDAYDYFLDQKQKMIEALGGFFECESRFLLRHTQQYSMNLNMSLFPEFLESREKRELFLHVLNKQSIRGLL